MKKIIFFTFLLGSLSIFSQDGKFGVSLGYNSLSVGTTINKVSVNTTYSGIYAGVWGEYNLNKKLSLRPEVQIAFKFKDGFSYKEYIALVALKYYFTDNFNMQLGPQLDYDSDIKIGGDALGLGAMFGVGYQINEKIDISARYSIGITNRITDGSGESKYNILQVGLGYRIF